jgi:hypothetical protein
VHTVEIGGKELGLFLAKHIMAATSAFTAAALASV